MLPETSRDRVQEPTERLGFLIWHLGQVINRRGERALSRLGLTLGQAAALRVLAVSPGLSSAELARRVGVTAQSIKQSADDLVARGLVARSPHPTHGRAIQLRVTDHGRALAEQAQALILAIEDELLLGLDAGERDSVVPLLLRMVRRVSPDAFP